MYNSALFYDRYRCIKKIGQGGSSTVYLCTDTNIGKKWAVKILYDKSESLISSPEIALLKSLDYYLFPRIVDAFYENGSLGIVTDYIEGESLSTYLKREGALPVNIALHYFEELLEALIYLHSIPPGILYLDMKPANIMIRPDGEIRLIDFGIAGSVLLKSKSMGSVGYSPPEQYILDATLSEKADVFALAMTLYSMITGHSPAGDLEVQRDRIKNSLSIPSEIKHILLKCTEFDVKLRPMPRELLMMTRNMGKKRKAFVPIFVSAALTCAVLASLVLTHQVYSKKKEYEKYKREMIENASKYIEEGEYTLDGIRIICGYINGDFLDSSTEEKFTYEVARNYFEVQKDYSMARVYFKRLDKSKYPGVSDYLEKCDSMCSFSERDKEIAKLLKLD